MTRNILKVIDDIIAVAPDLEPHFKSVCDSIRYSAPEVLSGPRFWIEAGEVLNTHAIDHEKQNEIAAIFSGTESKE